MSKKRITDFWIGFHSAIVLVGLGGFLAWAFLAPLSEGVTAGGQIIVEQNRKTLQHLEGGIVSAIHVSEGDIVEEGDVLFEIDALAVTSNREQVALERASLMANAERLQALIEDRRTLTFETADDWAISDLEAASIRSEQEKLFREQRQSYLANVNLLDQRMESLRVGEEKRSSLLASTQKSIAAVTDELELTQSLLEQRLARAEEVYRLERERSRLESDLANLEKQSLEIASQIIEIEKEKSQNRSSMREEFSSQLAKTRTEIAKANEQLKAIDDAVFRSRVVAPVSGQVMNLKFSTIGGVVGPGEPMLEIVPQSSGLWASVQVAPNDRESVAEGMKVRVQLAGFKSWKAPDIEGTIEFVSADLKTEEQSGLAYYEARVFLSEQDLNSHELPDILPGMPVQAFVESGRERTLAEYLIEPIYEHLKKGLSSG